MPKAERTSTTPSLTDLILLAMASERPEREAALRDAVLATDVQLCDDIGAILVAANLVILSVLCKDPVYSDEQSDVMLSRVQDALENVLRFIGGDYLIEKHSEYHTEWRKSNAIEQRWEKGPGYEDAEELTFRWREAPRCAKAATSETNT